MRKWVEGEDSKKEGGGSKREKSKKIKKAFMQSITIHIAFQFSKSSHIISAVLSQNS